MADKAVLVTGAVPDVHLRGSFNTSQAASSLFREQGSGAFVYFTSTSGLIGNVGQVNHAAAKMGGVEFSRGIGMACFGGRSNCIALFAWSRMIGLIPTETEDQQACVEKRKSLTPAKIAPMVMFWRPPPPRSRARSSACAAARCS
ncbi:MAG: hypothetical protein GDA49_07210 [Rhodospirillales bacterium]|nr:hypothetical protein [Rhodospirillales bacterium]